tara:strand:+ start:231 stop:1199 length:969 start_codon:yes stop_codon:yes gene_type:complete
MKLRIFLHCMPWEIDSCFSVCESLRRNSYYLSENDSVQFDFFLNLSDAVIDWDNSKLDKQFFIDKFNSMEKLNDWSNYKPFIYEGNEMWGHLDAFRGMVEDKDECDAYLSICPNVRFHNTLLFYIFRSMESIREDNYIINPEVVKLWDSSWDVLVNHKYKDIPYEEHEDIDCYNTEKVVNDNLTNVKLVENTEPHYKWAGWCDVHSSKLLDTVMYPKHWKGYGPMDTFFAYVLGTFRNWGGSNPEFANDLKMVFDGMNFKQYIIRNQIATSSEHFDLTRDFYEKRIKLKSKRQKQRDLIEAGIEKDIESTIENIIGEFKNVK